MGILTGILLGSAPSGIYAIIAILSVICVGMAIARHFRHKKYEKKYMRKYSNGLRYRAYRRMHPNTNKIKK